MHKKLLSLLITGILSVSTFSYALADPDTNDLTNQLNQNKSSLTTAQQNTKNLQSSLELLDEQIHKITLDMNETNSKIVQVQYDINSSEKDIQKSEEDMDEEQKLFNERMRAMYMNGSNGMVAYMKILLDSKGFSDLISRVETVKKIVNLDNKVLKDLNDKKESLKSKKEALEKSETELTSLKASNEEKLAKLNDSRVTQAALVKKAKTEELAYASKVNDVLKQIKAIRDAMPKYSPSRGSVPISSNAIVAYATNFLGRPYSYGANGPSSFDCSGFTKYVFAHFGVNLNRVAADQSMQGSYVAKNDLQPGDLVFFGSGYIHHVGIYVGNGCYIHAPQTGDVVKISSLDTRWSDYAGARRVR